MRLYPILIATLLIITCSSYAQQPADIPGWKTENLAGAYVFTPANNPGNGQAGFSYTIMPLRKESPANLIAWTEATLKADLSKKGLTLNQPVSNRTIQQIASCAATVHDNAGNKRVFTYFAYQVPGGSIRVAMFNSPAGYSPYMNQAATHLAAFSKKELALAPGQQASNTPDETKTTPPVASAPVKSDGAVRGIILHKETKWSGTLAMPYEAAYLMFNDGSTLMYVDDDPYTLDIAQSKRTNKNWGQWKQAGTDIILTYNSSNGGTQTEQWTKGRWRWAMPASNNDKIAGAFTAISIGGGFTGAFSGVAKNLTLNKAGQFALATSTATNYKDASGSSGVYSNRDNAGTYVLKGFSIELHFNNGKVDKHSFYFFDSDKNMFGIGKSIYTPDSK